MSNFFPLLQNENMKIYRRMRTWIMAALLLALMLAYFIIDNAETAKRSGDDWKSQLQSRIAQNEQTVANHGNMDERNITYFKHQIAIDKYRIEHNLNPQEKSPWTTASDAANMIMIISIFTIIIAGDMVAGEFTWGTIKLLLIRPASRSKILLTKYTATLLYSLLMLVLLFVAALILGGILHGFGNLSQPDVYVGSDGFAHERSMIVNVLKTYGLQCVSLLMMVTFAFMISAAFRSGIMAVGFSIGLLLAGSIIVQVLSRYSWVKYVLFANMNLEQYLGGGIPLRPDMTMGFSVTMLAIYFVVFNAISWTLFAKRDVAG